ncbi:uncharacterized protein LOC114720258 [Neltuma alba]|uniref:uncharacterized protein LOC114720258 n=1 Tax=Neltuma alba TaxID=207710 RepID=UPI0010A54375|nr:uncharacterized protein LOC114720258 [Prosopis alba]
MESTTHGKFRHQIFQIGEEITKWYPPPEGCLRLDTDGSMNLQRHASCGGLIRNPKGDWVLGFQRTLGCIPPMCTELLGVVTGLRICKQQGFNKILVYTNSLEVICLLMEDCGTDHPFKLAIEEGRKLIYSDWDIEVRHAPRETLYCADFVAKDAHQREEDMTLLLEPHPGCSNHLQADLMLS